MNNHTSHTFESVWAAMQENAQQLRVLRESQAETDRILRESRTETDLLIKANAAQQAKTDAQMARTDLQMAKTDRKLEKIGDMVGGLSNNTGLFAEEYFYESLERGEKRKVRQTD